MGGCRCSFRNCQNSSANTNKLARFFHFPHKDHERVEKWCINSNNKSFLTLSSDKLRNKVVCGYHFRIECFMNTNRERLVKTAVPTLLYLNFGGIVDLEKYKLPMNVTANTTAQELTSLGVEIEPVPELSISQADDKRMDGSPPAEKKVVLHNNLLLRKRPSRDSVRDEIKIDLQIEHAERDSFDSNEQDAMPPKSPPRFIRVPRQQYLNHKITVLDSKSLQPMSKRLKPTKIEEPPSTDVLEIIPLPNGSTVVNKNSTISEISSTEDPVEHQSPHANVDSEVLDRIDQLMQQQLDSFTDFRSFLTDSVSSMETSDNNVKGHLLTTQTLLGRSQTQLTQTQQQLTTVLVELRAQHAEAMAKIEKLADLPTRAQPALNTSESDSGKLEKNSMKKVQLFNGIKRYLNPAAVALLRMEMFGSAERPYRADEKNFAAELLNLGDAAYDYFTDEWRFRLPPKQAVKTWIEQSNDDDEDDL